MRLGFSLSVRKQAVTPEHGLTQSVLPDLEIPTLVQQASLSRNNPKLLVQEMWQKGMGFRVRRAFLVPRRTFGNIHTVIMESQWSHHQKGLQTTNST